MVVVMVGCTVGMVGAVTIEVGCVAGVVVGIPAGWQVIQRSPPVAGWLGGRVSAGTVVGTVVVVVVVGTADVSGADVVVTGAPVDVGAGDRVAGVVVVVGAVVGTPFGWQLMHGRPPVAG